MSGARIFLAGREGLRPAVRVGMVGIMAVLQSYRAIGRLACGNTCDSNSDNTVELSNHLSKERLENENSPQSQECGPMKMLYVYGIRNLMVPLVRVDVGFPCSALWNEG